jgi:hypothetical protein
MSKKCIDCRLLELAAMRALFAALFFTINDQGFEEKSQLPAVFN